MTFISIALIVDLSFIFLILYFLDEERKLPRIQRTRYTELREALLQFEDGKKMYAILCSEDRAIIVAKLFLYGKDGKKYTDFSKIFDIDCQDLISFDNTIIILANIDEDLAHDFIGLITIESDTNYIRTNSIPYRFRLL